MPLNGSDCGLPVALSVIVKAAVRVPVADGVKVTVMVQLSFGASNVGQVLFTPKSPTSAPVTEVDETIRLSAPVLVRVETSGTLGIPMV